MDEALRCAIALTQISGIGPIAAKRLLAHLGSFEEVFRASGRQLRRADGIGDRLARHILRTRGEAFRVADRELRFLEKHPEVEPLLFQDNRYPERLRHVPDSPPVLYFRGSVDLNASRVVAMVGTRKPGAYGRKLAERLIGELKPYGVCIVSGLAYGIDTIVHRACVDNGIPTVGVLGTGIRRVYPSSNRHLADQMMERGGLLTEFLHDAGPEREHFPMRNRIVAGMSDALVVVATQVRGGSIITADLANAYHREVFTFPGPIDDPGSSGCHMLVKTHRANLIEGADDLAYRMQWEPSARREGEQTALFGQLTEQERALVAFIRAQKEVQIDQLGRHFRMASQQMAVLLLDLECRGVLRSMPGNRYRLRS